MPAFRLPVTGSSSTPRPGTKARTSKSAGPPAAYGPMTPVGSRIRSRSGCTASTASASCSTATTQPGPLSTHSAATTSHAPMPRPSAIVAISSSVAGPERISGGAVEGPAVVRPTQRDEPDPALLHEPIGAGTGVLRPRVRGAERRVPGERQLGGRGEDPEAVVRPRHASAAARTSSRRGSSSARTPASRRRRARPRRARPRRGCRRAPSPGRRRPAGTAARSRDERAEALLDRLRAVRVDLRPRRAHLGEAGERVGAEVEVHRGEVLLQLLDRARAEDRARDGRLRVDPGERDGGGGGARPRRRPRAPRRGPPRCARPRCAGPTPPCRDRGSRRAASRRSAPCRACTCRSASRPRAATTAAARRPGRAPRARSRARCRGPGGCTAAAASTGAAQPCTLAIQAAFVSW